MRRKRLIEVAFPLEEVSEHSRREKNIRHGHISTLHIWWARRPLAACRAFIYASLVDAPKDPREREELLKEVADLASWDAVRKPALVVRAKDKGGSGLTGHQLLERARARILRDNDNRPPRLLDPFAGGGAIPLEALRLGCEAEASDLNPVAVLILKGTVEYPQKYGRPLAEQLVAQRRGERDSIAGVNGDVPRYILDSEAPSSPLPGLGEGGVPFGSRVRAEAYRANPLAADVRYWGNWMLERARAELAQFYPPDPDGSVPVAYLWSRTVPCPSCGAEMPLIRQYWLARKEHKKVALEPVIDHANKRVDFKVVEGPDVTGDPSIATTSRGDTMCLVCRQVAKVDYIRDASRRGSMGATLTAVVLEARGKGGKRYRADLPRERLAIKAAASHLAHLHATHEGDTSLVPDEPIAPETLGLRIDNFGITEWGRIFNERQQLALVTFAALVHLAHAQMCRCGHDRDYATAVATYLGLAVDRLADYNSTLSRWGNDDEGITNTFSRQVLSMVWDYGEANPVGSSGGSWESLLNGQVAAIHSAGTDTPVVIRQLDARASRATVFDLAVTDPPYYNAIDYAGLSDFFYVWLKRSLNGIVEPDMVRLPLTPKREQAIMASETQDAPARERYVRLMAEAFDTLGQSVSTDGLVGVVFAHTDPDAWATLIASLLKSSLVPDASWPIDTEQGNKISSASRANLKTSVWMVCRPRDVDAGDAFLGDVLDEMRPVIRERLLYFWSKGIRGADFFISAIGPALSVFGRHARVMRPDGSQVTVREFLDLVRRESSAVALEQVLEGADLGVVDPITRQYVTWVWSYSRAALDAGEAIALCLATGADYSEVVRDGSIGQEAREKSKKVVRLRTIRDRGREDEGLGEPNGARPVALIDQLQRAAWLWSDNQTGDLALYRGQLGETRWQALRTLGQAVAECLPETDEDRRLIRGLMGSSVMALTNGPARPAAPPKPETLRLPIDEG